MDIGGCDFIFYNIRNAHGAADFSLRLIKVAWPDMVVDDVSEPGNRWLLVYRNKEADDLWEKHGHGDAWGRDLIHLIVTEGEDMFTIVANDDECPLTWDICESLNNNRIFFGNFECKWPNDAPVPLKRPQVDTSKTV